MKTADLKNEIAELNEEAMFADGFEAALVGYVETYGNPVLALYDRDKCIGILMKRDGMTREEAIEFFEFNVAGAYVGKGTPCFATFFRRKG